MTFINPAWLWLLPLAFIPLIIHLLNLQRYRVVYFSNLRFLEKIEQQHRTRTRLKEILVLLMRILSIVALVLAFARPVRYASSNVRPCSAVVMYVDNSFSMDGRNKSGLCVEVAKKQAFMLTKVFPMNQDYLFLSNDLSPMQQQIYDASTVADLISKTHTNYYVRKLSFIVQKISNLLKPDTSCKPYVFLFSDFQKVTADLGYVKFLGNWQVFLVPIYPQKVQNIALDSAFFGSPYHIYNSKDSLVLVIKNYGDEAVKDLQIRLFLNDTLKSFVTVSLEPKEQKFIPFTYINGQSGWNYGRFEITDYPITFDNELFFSYFVKSDFKVLVISQQPNKYLRAFYSQQPFSLDWRTMSNLPYSKFSQYSAIIVNGLNEYSQGLINELRKYVENGGSLVIIPDSNFSSVNNLLSSLNISRFTAIDTHKVYVSEVNLNSIIYKNSVESYEPNQLMPFVRSFGVREPNYKNETPLLVLKNGTIALSQISMGRGNVYVLAFPLDQRKTNFMLHPLFVPTFYNLAVFSGVNSQPLYYTLSRDKLIKINQQISSEYLELKNDSITYIPPVQMIANQTVLNLSYAKLPAGTYKLMSKDSLIQYVSFNYWRKESDLDYFTPKEIERIIKSRHLQGQVKIYDINKVNLQSSVKQQIEVKKLWKVFVILALIFLFLEILINRYL